MTEIDLFQSRRLPARLTIEQLAQLLGFQVYGMEVLAEREETRNLSVQTTMNSKMLGF